MRHLYWGLVLCVIFLLVGCLEEDDGSESASDSGTAEIAGVWSTDATDNELLALVFLTNGTYLHFEVDEQTPYDETGEESGMEWGTFSRDADTGELTVSQTYDNNADTGFTDATNGKTKAYAQVESDELTMQFDDNLNGTIDSGESLKFTRTSAEGLQGPWISELTDDDLLGFVFFADGTYVHLEVDEKTPYEEAGQESGMEMGSYSRDASTGELTVTINFDNNGTTGFTDALQQQVDFFAQVSGDEMTLQFDDNKNGSIDDGESLKFKRP
ncbi:hypothetical protein [Marinospirillum perlucidum]|uniref:hypothetical protein n=1 Tax=Marinospirillum perlucidum TaxID=1982602 RepID=UPI000DF18CBF|nr:hypothetical protein [Marinospirillum perlucidum]